MSRSEPSRIASGGEPLDAGTPDSISQDLKPAPAWGVWAGGLLAVGLCVAALLQIRDGYSDTLLMVRSMPPFAWVCFASLCLVQPIADMVIFRRLWGLPMAGFPVIVRKVVINEVLFGYSGELYFYLWARRRAELSQAPFGAIKDVNILSALAGNVLTLLMLPVGIAGVAQANLAPSFAPALWPALVVIALSFGVLFFSKRVFSLTRKELGFVTWVHAARLAANNGLTFLVWWAVLPDVEIGVWLTLLAGRLLLARLPFVTNRELMFANLVLVLFGAGSKTVLLLVALAIGTLMAHLALAAVVSVPDLVRFLMKVWRRARSGGGQPV